jgi:hypothetical protein
VALVEQLAVLVVQVVGRQVLEQQVQYKVILVVVVALKVVVVEEQVRLEALHNTQIMVV